MNRRPLHKPFGFRHRVMRLHDDESGLFSVSHLFTTLFLATVSMLLFNVGVTLVAAKAHRLKADAAARSVGTLKARYLNLVTAQQHLIGQMVGMITIHHAIGGELLDAQQAASTQEYDAALAAAHQLAQDCSTGTPAYQDIVSPVLAGKALLEAQIHLKQDLTKVYVVKAIAMVMQELASARSFGQTLEQIAHGHELALHAEWSVLEQLRVKALSLVELKRQLRDQLLPLAFENLHATVEQYPEQLTDLLSYLEKAMDVQVHVLPSDRVLPLQEDPLARQMQLPENWERPAECDCPSVAADNMRHQIVKTSQLARATFPWTNYHRRAILDKMSLLTPLTEFADLYFDHTNGVSKEFADLWQRDGECALYCLRGYEGPDKGYEDWHSSEGSALVDQHLNVTVLVAAARPKVLAGGLFQSSGTEFNFRYASAMVFNQLPNHTPMQRIDWYCKRIVPTTQAMIGTDTLNWSQLQPRSELVGIGVPSTFPQVELGWSSRLSTTSTARVLQLKQQGLPSWAAPFAAQVPDELDSFLGD